MPDVASPAEVFHALANGVPRLLLGDPGSLDRLVELYAEPTDVRHPLAAAEVAPLHSRADVRRHFAGGSSLGDGLESFEAVDRVVHVTDDPEVVVAEFRYTGSVRGRSFEAPCIFVLRVRDGRIVESRDYVDHAGLARGFGGAG